LSPLAILLQIDSSIVCLTTIRGTGIGDSQIIHELLKELGRTSDNATNKGK